MSAAALGKVVEIGLVASADISEEVLARDSDAAPSVLWPEQRWLGQLLSTEYTAPGESHSESAPSWMCYALQALCVVTALVSVPNIPGDYAEMAGMTEPNVLLYMFAAMLGICMVAPALPISSAREALRPGGALEQLGVGEIMISAEDARSNARWRKGLLALGAICPLIGAFLIVSAIFEIPPFGVIGHTPMTQQLGIGLFGMEWCTVFPVAFSGWLASMRTA
eukprot:COSAG06_NODE_20716_length_784_cov_1.058394_1_plen_222_part_01